MHDMNQAVAVLSNMHHWSLQAVNRKGVRYCYECTIWHRPAQLPMRLTNGKVRFMGGKRVTGHGKTPLLAIVRALDKLRDHTTCTGLKVVSK